MDTGILLSFFHSKNYEREKTIEMTHTPSETKLSIVVFAWIPQCFLDLYNNKILLYKTHDVKQAKPIHIECKK